MYTVWHFKNLIDEEAKGNPFVWEFLEPTLVGSTFKWTSQTVEITWDKIPNWIPQAVPSEAKDEGYSDIEIIVCPDYQFTIIQQLKTEGLQVSFAHQFYNRHGLCQTRLECKCHLAQHSCALCRIK